MFGFLRVVSFGLVLGLAACSVPGPGEAPNGVHDPHEQMNRSVHAFNRGLDKAVVGPVARSYVAVVPEAPRAGIDNLVETLSLPKSVVNQLLQARFGDAARNSGRFVTNLTFGMLGLRDAASSIGLNENPSDFGETLHVWGFPEGAYVELPLLGPSNERDSVGFVVDLFLDPVGTLISPQQAQARTATRALDVLNTRGELDGVITEVLHESADSYSQAQLLYLQNRRHELGDTSSHGAQEELDPFALDTEGF